MTDSITDKKLSRRQFVGVAAGGAAALGAVAGASALIPSVAAVPTAEASKVSATGEARLVKTNAARKMLPTVIPSSWDYTADVVVVGMGFGGEAAAITANDLGANVILLEKGSAVTGPTTGTAGGNSRVCGQGIWVPGTDQNGNANESNLFDELVYFEAMEDGQGFPTDDDLIQTYVANCANNKHWLEGLGATVIPFGAFPQPFYPQLPGASGVSTPYGGSWTVKGNKPYGNNWFFLQAQIQNRPINVMYSTPAVGLIQDPNTGEIKGVRANPVGGSTINIAAKKGVILTCGGYEFNANMNRDYGPNMPNQVHFGSPLNTGDGIHMAQAVGADLWHMNVWAAPNFNGIQTPQYDSGIGVSTPSKGGFIFLGADSKRYSNETAVPGPDTVPSPGQKATDSLMLGGTVIIAGKYYSNGVYVTPFYPQPVHMVFDTVGFGSGPLFSGFWSSSVEGYVADPTNKTELANGWIYEATTLSALATIIGKDSTVMPAEVASWNTMVAAGTDTEFGRTTSLTAINTAPYYAIQIQPGILNTQGGPRRNSKGEVLDTNGNPIPRLYEAGEIGEVISYLYQCMRNVSMCYGMGRIAATNAVALTSWQ